MASESAGDGTDDAQLADAAAEGEGEAEPVEPVTSTAEAVEQLTGEAAVDPSPSGLRAVVRTSMVTGAAVVVPLLITVIVLVLAASLVSDALSPFVRALSWLPVGIADPLVLEVATVAILVVVMLLVGYVSAFRIGPSPFAGRIEAFLESLPGVGAVYKSFNQMSKLVLDSDSQSFKEVVLVQYPTEGSYVIAFRTGTPTDSVATATGHGEMVTLFMPMGPNPFLGGFVLHVDRDSVVEVDLTVEEGIRSILTSGVATGSRPKKPR